MASPHSGLALGPLSCSLHHSLGLWLLVVASCRVGNQQLGSVITPSPLPSQAAAALSLSSALPSVAPEVWPVPGLLLGGGQWTQPGKFLSRVGLVSPPRLSLGTVQSAAMLGLPGHAEMVIARHTPEALSVGLGLAEGSPMQPCAEVITTHTTALETEAQSREGKGSPDRGGAQMVACPLWPQHPLLCGAGGLLREGFVSI